MQHVFLPRGRQRKSAASALPSAREVSGGTRREWEACPLSSGQTRVWFTEEISQETAANNLHLGVLVTGKLDTIALARAYLEPNS
jgi:hypothetical protein